MRLTVPQKTEHSKESDSSDAISENLAFLKSKIKKHILLQLNETYNSKLDWTGQVSYLELYKL